MSITIVRPLTSITVTPKSGDIEQTVAVSHVQQQVTVKLDGSTGPQGPQGPQGPPGLAGSDAVDDPGDLTLFFNNALI